MKHEWSGDVDWGDGALQEKHRKYEKLLEFVGGIGSKKRKDPICVKHDLSIPPLLTPS